jgi:hypothetical protein
MNRRTRSVETGAVVVRVVANEIHNWVICKLRTAEPAQFTAARNRHGIPYRRLTLPRPGCTPACSIIKVSNLSGRGLDRGLTVVACVRARFIERTGCPRLAGGDSERQHSPWHARSQRFESP